MWAKIIWLIISNLPTIIKIIKELIELFSDLSGEPSVDERMKVAMAKVKLDELAKKTGIGSPPDLVR